MQHGVTAAEKVYKTLTISSGSIKSKNLHIGNLLETLFFGISLV